MGTLIPADRDPRMAEMLRTWIMGQADDFGDEFVVGLDLILDRWEDLAAQTSGQG